MAFWDYVAPALAGAGTGFLAGGPIGAVVGAGVGAIGYDQTQKAATQAYNRSNQQVQNQESYQTSMSNTAHQREVKDLEAAGLNPVLSAEGGPGASTPGGATGQVSPAQVSLPDVMQAFSVANATKQTDLQGQLLELQKTKQAVDIAKTTSDTDLNRANLILAQKGMARANAEGEYNKLQTEFFKQLKQRFSDWQAYQRSLNNPPSFDVYKKQLQQGQPGWKR